jgi:hypothetical protein
VHNSDLFPIFLEVHEMLGVIIIQVWLKKDKTILENTIKKLHLSNGNYSHENSLHFFVVVWFQG